MKHQSINKIGFHYGKGERDKQGRQTINRHARRGSGGGGSVVLHHIRNQAPSRRHGPRVFQGKSKKKTAPTKNMTAPKTASRCSKQQKIHLHTFIVKKTQHTISQKQPHAKLSQTATGNKCHNNRFFFAVVQRTGVFIYAVRPSPRT